MRIRRTDRRSAWQRPRAAVGAATVVAASALLTACSPLPADDVPIEGTAPWVCAGVSRASVDLILGEGYTVLELGDWAHLEDDPFTCEVNGVHGNVIVEVEQRPRDNAQAQGAEQLAQWRGSGAEQLDNPHGVPGEGYRWGTPGDVVTTGWVCGTRTAQVQLEWVWIDDVRDQRADAANLLAQVLPYACAGEMVPGVDYSSD